MNINDMLSLLRSRGMKVTPQRIEIIRTLIELKDDHPSLKQLYEEVRKRVPTISFSTLYSTIQKLEELGVVKLFDLLGETRVEVNKKPHINLIDLKKNKITDILDEDAIEFLKRRLGLKGERFILVNVLVYTDSIDERH